MNAFIVTLRNSRKYLTYPFMMAGVFAVIAAFAGVSSDYTVLVFGFCAPAFLGYYFCKNSKKGIACSVCVLCADLLLFSLTGRYFSLVAVLLLSAFAVFVFKRLNLVYGFFALIISFSLLAVAAGNLSYLLTALSKSAAGLIKGRGFLFGSVSAFSELFVSDELSRLFFYKSYSESLLINGEIVSGVKNIFTRLADNSVSLYLSGKYFVSVFLSLGLLAAVFNRVHSDERLSFIILIACAVLTGDIRLLSLFVLLYNPLVYAVYLIAISASYFAAQVLDIRAGYLDNGGLIELIRYIDKPAFLIITGLVLAVTMYFAARLVIAKMDLGAEVYYPKNARAVIEALGGGENIDYIRGEKVIVRNPNLINILTLDCDIKANTVTLYKDDFDLIKPYFA